MVRAFGRWVLAGLVLLHGYPEGPALGLRYSLFARCAVLVLQRADARLDLVGRGDRRRDCGRSLSGGFPPTRTVAATIVAGIKNLRWMAFMPMIPTERSVTTRVRRRVRRRRVKPYAGPSSIGTNPQVGKPEAFLRSGSSRDTPCMSALGTYSPFCRAAAGRSVIGGAADQKCLLDQGSHQVSK